MEKPRGIIIGFGNMGVTHLAHFSALGAEIMAVADPDQAPRDLAAEQGIPSFVAYADMPQSMREQADFAVIATPTPLHARQITECLQFRGAVFCEKPVVRTAVEAEGLLRLDKEQPRLFVGEVEQYNPAFAPLLELADEPAGIQMSRSVDLEFFLRGARPWFLDVAQSGGLALDVMIHDISLLVLRFGRPQVGKVEAKRGPYSAADALRVELVFSGFTANLFGTWSAKRPEQPILAGARLAMPDGREVRLECDTYTIRDKPRSLDAFAEQAEAFLEVVRGRRPAPSVRPYAEAVLVALEINDRIPGLVDKG